MFTVTRCTLFLSLCLFLALPTFAQNVSITDYQVPVSSAKKIIADGTYDWRGTSSVPQTNTIHGDLQYNQFYSSLPFAWFLGANGAADHSLNTDWHYQTGASAEARKYLYEDRKSVV